MSNNMNKKEEPYFVNGELKFKNEENKNKDDYKEVKNGSAKDLLLTLLCIGLIVYGGYSLLNKKDTKKTKKEEPIVNVKKIDQKQNKDELYKYLVLSTIEESSTYNVEDYSNMNNGISPSMLSNNAKLAIASKLCELKSYSSAIYINGSEMDKAIKKVFGNIKYDKKGFTIGNSTFTYNEELDRYYKEYEANNKLNYIKYNRVQKVVEDDNIIVFKEYVLYNSIDNTSSWSLNNLKYNIFISDTSIDQYINSMKGYVYTFSKVDDKFILTNIKIQ